MKAPSISINFKISGGFFHSRNLELGAAWEKYNYLLKNRKISGGFYFNMLKCCNNNCYYQQEDDDQDQRPVMGVTDIQDTGEGLEANPFTMSESFKKLDQGQGRGYKRSKVNL